MKNLTVLCLLVVSVCSHAQISGNPPLPFPSVIPPEVLDPNFLGSQDIFLTPGAETVDREDEGHETTDRWPGSLALSYSIEFPDRETRLAPHTEWDDGAFEGQRTITKNFWYGDLALWSVGFLLGFPQDLVAITIPGIPSGFPPNASIPGQPGAVGTSYVTGAMNFWAAQENVDLYTGQDQGDGQNDSMGTAVAGYDEGSTSVGGGLAKASMYAQDFLTLLPVSGDYVPGNYAPIRDRAAVTARQYLPGLYYCSVKLVSRPLIVGTVIVNDLWDGGMYSAPRAESFQFYSLMWGNPSNVEEEVVLITAHVEENFARANGTRTLKFDPIGTPPLASYPFTSTPGPDGRHVILRGDLKCGTYRVSAQGAVSRVIEVIVPDVATIPSLYLGDVDKDNEVGPSDWEVITAFWGTNSGDATWTRRDTTVGLSPSRADLDMNGEIGPGDFEIITENFGLLGD